MTSFPTPLVPTVQPRPDLPWPFDAVPDGLNGWFVERATPDRSRVGHAFPRVVTDLAGDWFGKHHGPRNVAQAFPGEVQALAYVCGCEPSEIRFEEATP